jgi:nicotinate phosphoribosyltransferase
MKFNTEKVRYKLFLRDSVKFPDGFDKNLRELVRQMSELTAPGDEFEFFKSKCKYLPDFYFDFLKGYRFDPSEVGITQNDGMLTVTIEGFWFRTILWETFLMSIISQLYFEMTNKKPLFNETELKNRNLEKANLFYCNNIPYTDFGSRRRYSLLNHDNVIRDFKSAFGNMFIGTSNVHFGIKHKVNKLVGTMAHEFIQFHSAYYGYEMANKMAMKNWTKIYGGELGTFLPDTFTTDVALKSFDGRYARLFDSVRHDSADPFVFGDKIIEHYKTLGIDPITKTIIFSDSLNVNRCLEIFDHFRGKIKTSFGIGTTFTNDVGVKPLNMVIKMTEAFINDKWINVIKLSDDPGKNTGDKETIELAKKILNI